MQFDLHPRQSQCFLSDATEILYGGAAGGGKSHTMRVIAIYHAISIPNIQIYLFRRLSEDLKKNHLDGSSGFNALLAEYLEAGFCKINYSTSQIVFTNGAKIHLCHCQHEKDVLKYQGVEINLLLIDELTHFSEYIYKFLRSRVRLGGLQVPAAFKDKLPKIIASSNPGGVGHDFVKRMFVDLEAFKVHQMSDEEGGMKRQYIPAKLSDNPTMLENDPLYRYKLEGLGGALAKAMLEGDWDAIEGAFFDKFDKTKHVIEPFEIPSQWYRFRAFDYGYSAPFSVGWYAVSEGKEVNGVWIPAGALIKYREYYGTTGKVNEGLRLENNQLAAEILRLQGDEKIRDSVADPAIFAHNGGVSIGEQLQRCGVDFRRADNERVAGWQQIRYRLVGEDRPMLYFFKTCVHTIRQLAILQHDKSRVEDLDTDMEDHACFAGETLVDTDKGQIQIKNINPSIHRIKAGTEWTNNYFPSLTRKRAKTIKLTFENGVEIICTPDHKILDSSDEWRYAKDFLNIEAQWNQQLLVKRSSNTKARIITFVANIFKEKVLGCTGWFGRTLTEKFQRVFISITKTKILRIISFQILNVCQLVTTQRSTTRNRKNKHVAVILKKLKLLLQFGTEAKKVENGTNYTGKITAKIKQPKKQLEKIAKIAQVNILQQNTQKVLVNSAGITVKLVRCVSVENWSEQPVYCLTEPKTSTFTIEGGLIVHNCDETRYACMSRPLTIKHIDPIIREEGKIYVDQATKQFKQLIKQGNDARL